MTRLFLILTSLLLTLSLFAEKNIDIEEEPLFSDHYQAAYQIPSLFSLPHASSYALPQIPKVNVITGEYCDEC